jgi:hypothetical protein
MLETFFQSCDLITIQKMIDIIKSKHIISLRFIEWFVIRYCSLYITNIDINNKFTKQKGFNINMSYEAQIKSFTKMYFDPFKRGKKFIFPLNKFNISFVTTLGQLNFFKWLITFDIINYAENNHKDIISKYKHVNAYFKKDGSDYSFNSCDTSNNTISSRITEMTSSQDNGSTITTIYKKTNNNVLIENLSTKSTFKIPLVHRNIRIEL